MINENRKFDDYIENSLRRSAQTRTSDNFTAKLMQKVTAESKSALAEIKTERIAKYIIGIFISLTLAVTVIVGYLSGGEVNSKIETTNVKIQPTIETSTSFVQQLLGYISSFAVWVFNLFGITASPQTINIFLYLVGIILLYILADRIFLKGRLKSQQS